MSKSYGNTIPLFGSTQEIEKAVMSIVTDSEGDKPEHVYAIHRLLKTEAELEPLYEEYKGRYGDLKKALAQDLEELIAPMREKRAAITQEMVSEVLAAGAVQAQETSQHTLKKVRAAIGID
jgi:tryptophanyl-tRNA synthetase